MNEILANELRIADIGKLVRIESRGLEITGKLIDIRAVTETTERISYEGVEDVYVMNVEIEVSGVGLFIPPWQPISILDT